MKNAELPAKRFFSRFRKNFKEPPRRVQGFRLLGSLNPELHKLGTEPLEPRPEWIQLGRMVVRI